MKLNDDVIRKTIETSDLVNGGLLDPERQTEFLQLIRGEAVLLKLVRFEKKTRVSGSIERLHIGEPITSSADENTLPLRMAEPKFDRIPYTTTKTRSDWNITRETVLQNIEQEDFDDSVMTAMTTAMKVDFERLGINGDAATFAAVNTPLGFLLRSNDGWDILTNNAHIVDAAGAEIAREMFSASARAMPADKKMDPDLQWFINPDTLTDYVDLYGSRATAGGDRANVEGTIEQIFGRPVTAVPLISTTQNLTVTAATAGATLGGQLGPFVVDATNNNLLLAVDGGANTPVSLTAGLLMTVEVARLINVAMGANIAFDDGYGRLLLQSTTTGAASAITVVATANDAYTLLGLTVGNNAGSAAGVAGVVSEGSFVWLTNPKNFIWINVLETALFSEFNKDMDRLEMVTFAMNDFIVENLDAVVKLINVRRRQLL